MLGCEKLNLSKAKKTDKAQTEQNIPGEKRFEKEKKSFIFRKLGKSLFGPLLNRSKFVTPVS